jgi:hypothetical protein
MLGARSGWDGQCTAVVLWRRIVERNAAARFNPARRAGAEAQPWRRSATTEGQASGGARDWNGARRVEIELVAQ